MTGPARITSTDVVRNLKVALAEFEDDARDGVAQLLLELRRALDWVEHDRARYWPREVQRASDRGSAAAQASQFYELIRQQQRAEVVRRYPAMAKEALSPAEAAVFRDFEQQFRQELSLELYQKGLQLAAAKKHEEAIARFEEAIQLHPDGTHIPAVKHSLALSLRKEKRSAEALIYAQQVAKQTVDVALQPDGWWLVALCARDLDDLDTAKDALKTLINKWPRSAITRDARPVFREVTREIWQGKQTATTPTAPDAQ